MKYTIALILFAVLILTVINAQKPPRSEMLQCETNVNQLCTNKGQGAISSCNSIITTHKWGQAEKTLQSYAKFTLKKSYELLALAINHGSYSRNRPGFEKLFRSLSDASFDDAIKIIKYISGRGGQMTFDSFGNDVFGDRFYKNEFEAMSIAQDIEKKLLETAHNFDHATHDPGTLHFIQKEFILPKTNMLRALTGYVHDLDKLSTPSDSSLNVFLFDKHIESSSHSTIDCHGFICF